MHRSPKTFCVVINEVKLWVHTWHTYRVKHQIQYLDSILICVKSSFCTAWWLHASNTTWLTCFSGSAHWGCAVKPPHPFHCPSSLHTELNASLSGLSVCLQLMHHRRFTTTLQQLLQVRNLLFSSYVYS